jgi:hypothetical protein
MTTTHRFAIARLLLVAILLVAAAALAGAQNVIIVVIDGARYSESLGAKAANMPVLWNTLRPKGTIYTNFRNEGVTKTCAGHTAVITGVWHDMPNDGTVRPWEPTVFELFRKKTALPESSCFVVSGKKKLFMLDHSTHADYGASLGAVFVDPDTSHDPASDEQVWADLSGILQRDHPRLVVVNLPDVDKNGHAKDWQGYLGAIKGADAIIGKLWTQISADRFYRGKTTLFVTNDHGRHDPEHGDFQNHGCPCEGCRHIMCLAMGPRFKAGAVVREPHTQLDIAATTAAILGFDLPKSDGVSLLGARR